MSTLRVLSATFVLSVLLAGCASLSKDECTAGDWKGIGVQDGMAGKPASRIEDHKKACSKYGVSPDLASYQAGRSIGLKSYCTIPSGFQQGRMGRSYSDACPSATAPAFQKGYSLGFELRNAHSKLDDVESRISYAENRIDDLRYEIASTSCASGKEGKNCRRVLRDKRDEIRDLRSDVTFARLEILQAQANLELVRERVISEMSYIAPGFVIEAQYQ
ncbi:DUF2799 domain-containing protein [Pseudovibrio exalbescens]|uniref:DUF2799 domain-containing protein n=1 Tax=Pseudovibrio exalbescens TaxID=197461 RepID=UPI002366B4F6|nr:DUF2799 domain-containing protein [Pseudovibrio exalbescens]MDD7910035.1 DUF2799 domain-containing protein [Pseudovibrio exalbescens]